MAEPPPLLFAPGAGAPSSSEWMRSWQERLASFTTVVPFDYPYMLAGRRRPDPLERLVAAHRHALASARERYGPHIALIGKSMGSRIGCHVALEEHVPALVCFGYPLRAAASGKLRDEVLVALRTPILFIQGTRDPLCSLDELAGVRARMSAPSVLHVVEGGDHSLLVTKTELKRRDLTQAAVDQRIAGVIADFLRQGVFPS